LAVCAGAGELWTRAYGGAGDEKGYEVVQTADGGYAVVGETNSFGAGLFDIYLVRTDSNGDSLWTRTYGGGQYEFGYSLVATPDSGFLIAGVTTSFGAGGRDVYLVRTDAQGETLWTKTYGGTNHDAAGSVITTADGGCLIVGTTYSYGAGGADLYILKTDADGESLWAVTHGGTQSETGWSVKETGDGGYVIGGQTLSYGAGDQDVYIVRTDSAGGLVWMKTYGGSGDDRGFSVEATLDGGYLTAGRTYSFGVGGADIYVVKTDSAGDSIWTKTYGSLINDEANAVLEEPSGVLVIAGYAYSFISGSNEAYLLALDVNGDSLWAEMYGGSGEDVASSALSTGMGGYVIAGLTSSLGAGGLDLYIAQVEPPTGAVLREAPEVLKPSLNVEPNPFRGGTLVNYSLQAECRVDITIHNLLGQRVKTLSCGTNDAGTHSMLWDARDDGGRSLPSGVYWARLTTDTDEILLKMIFLE